MEKNQNIFNISFGVSLCTALMILLFSCETPQGDKNTPKAVKLDTEKSARVEATSKLRIGYLWFNNFCTNCLRDNIAELEKQIHKDYYKNLTHINLSFVNPINDLGTSVAITETGSELGYEDSRTSYVLNQTNVKKIVTNLKNMNPKIRIGLAIGGGSANGVDGTIIYKRYKSILPDSKKRATLVKTIVAYAKNTGCDYLDIDLEYNALTITGFNEFVKECKQSGINVTLTLEYLYGDNGVITKVNNVKDAYNYCDLLNIMSYNYDETKIIGKGTERNHSPVKVAKTDIIYFSKKVNPDKIVLGIPAYGKNEFSTGSEEQYSNINIADLDPSSGFHKKTKKYFNSKDILKSKLALASDYGIAGIMLWSVRHDKIGDYNNSILKYIVDNQK